MTLYRFWELNPGTLREGSQLLSHHSSSASNLGNVLGSFTTWRLLKLRKDSNGDDVMLLCLQIMDSLFLEPTLTITNVIMILNSLRSYCISSVFLSGGDKLFYFIHLVQCTKMWTPSGNLKTGGYLGSWLLNVQRGSASEVCLYSCYLSITVTQCLRKST